MPADATPESGDSVAAIIKLYQRDVDRSILRGQLSRTPEQRFCDVMDRQAAAQAFRRAGRDGLRTR